MDDQPDTHAYELHDAEDPLFIIYTSGTTGKPKGLVHTMAGYLVQTAYTHALLYDLLPDYVDENGVLRPDELSAVNDPEKVESTVHWCYRRPRLGDRTHLRNLRPSWLTVSPR